MIRFATCCLSALLTAACASAVQNTRVQPVPPAVADNIASAERAITKARASGFLWTGTEALLAKAQQELSSGQTDSAHAHAEEARFQAETAVAQYELARLKFARSNIDPKNLSEPQLELLLVVDEKIRTRETQEALKLLAEIDPVFTQAMPQFYASQDAYLTETETLPTVADSTKPVEYQLRRVGGRPGKHSTRLVPAQEGAPRTQ